MAYGPNSSKAHETETESNFATKKNTVTHSWQHTRHLLQTRFLTSKHSVIGCVPITRGEFTFCTEDYLIPSQIWSLVSTTRDVFPVPPHCEQACVCVLSGTSFPWAPVPLQSGNKSMCSFSFTVTRAVYFPQTPVGLEKPERVYPWCTPEERNLCNVSSRLRTRGIAFHPSISKRQIHPRTETYLKPHKLHKEESVWWDSCVCERKVFLIGVQET